jgi:hypothetical protein
MPSNLAEGLSVEHPDLTQGLIVERPQSSVAATAPEGAPAANAETTPTMSRLEAAKLGYLSGASANFGDEVYGLSKASGLPDWLGGFRAPVGAARMLYGQATTPNPEFMNSYDQAVAERRGQNKAAEQQYPGTYLAGQVGGALVLPGGASAQAATLPARMGRGAVLGSAYGAASGLGEGENDVDRLKKGAMGTILGGVTGGAAPALVEGALAAGRTIAAPIASTIRGGYDPRREAARAVGATLGRDITADPAAQARLTPQEFAGNVAGGGPATVMDLGSQATRDLARTAVNASPEAEQILNATINPRFETQSNRVADWMRQRFNYPNAFQREQALEQASRAANNPAYRDAYQAGAGNIGSPELERLASSDTVAAAMQRAAKAAKDEAVVGGYGAMNPRVTFTPDGRVIFQKSPSGMPLYPDLQFWDLTRRELSKAANVARRAGDDTEARRAGHFAQSLNTELDQIVPEYGVARTGAAGFFNAENALEAGQNFFGQVKRFGVAPAEHARSQMSPAQQRLFEEGYATRHINAIEGIPNRQNVVPHIGGSPAANAEMDLAYGVPAANELRGVRRVEDVMDRARGAVQGNSTTAKQQERLRQLTELGIYGASAGTGVYGASNLDPTQVGLAGAAAALTAGRRHVNQNVMRHVAEVLTSQDPATIARNNLTQRIMQNPAALRAATDQALATTTRRAQSNDVRSALARALLARGATGGAIPLEMQQGQ